MGGQTASAKQGLPKGEHLSPQDSAAQDEMYVVSLLQHPLWTKHNQESYPALNTGGQSL